MIIRVWAFFDRITGPSWSVGESEWFIDFNTDVIQKRPMALVHFEHDALINCR